LIDITRTYKDLNVCVLLLCVHLQVRVVSSFGKNSAGAVVVFKLSPSTSSAAASALLSELQKRQQNDRSSMEGPLAMCLLADHDTLSQEWRNALGAPAASALHNTAPGFSDQTSSNSENGGFFYIVVPPAEVSIKANASNSNAPAPSPSQLVWYCGLFHQARLREGAMRAVIDSAVAAKRTGNAFSKLAKDWVRLEELASTLQGCSGGASRLEHLFAKTPLAVRSQLQLDATAAYSVTDQTTADEITQYCLKLRGVKEALSSGSGLGCACVDLTACIGGNLLSFVQGGFTRVVGVESDAARFAMLKHNVKVVVPSHLTSRVDLIYGDSTALLHESNDSSSSGSSNSHGVLNSSATNAAAASSSLSSNALWMPKQPTIYFLDPPWGGLDYKDHDRVSLYLGTEDIASVCLKCLALPGCLHVVLKAPYNADTSDLVALTASKSAAGAPMNSSPVLPPHRSACGTQSFKVLPMQTWSLSKKVKCFVLSRENLQDREESTSTATTTVASKKKKKKSNDASHAAALSGGNAFVAGKDVEPSTSSMAEELAQMACEAQSVTKASKKKRAKKAGNGHSKIRPLVPPEVIEEQPVLKKAKLNDKDEGKDISASAIAEGGEDFPRKSKKKKREKHEPR